MNPNLGRKRRPIRWILLVAMGLIVLPGNTPQQGLPEVDPADLLKRPELVGRALAVEDRPDGPTRFTRNRGFNELHLRRAPGVIFRLPAQYATSKPEEYPAVRVEGLLRRDGNQLVFEVTEMRIDPDDLTRLDRELKALSETDAAGRSKWAEWAQKRAAAFRDPVLERRAREIEAEAIRIEAETAVNRTPEQLLELAERGRKQGVPGAIPAALTHRAFRMLLPRLTQVGELETLVERGGTLLPRGRDPLGGGVSADSTWLGRYRSDPYTTYVEAPADVQRALDRRLTIDVITKWLEARAAANPSQSLQIADEARQRIPDQPMIAARLEDMGIAAADENLANLPQSELEAITRRLNEREDPKRAEAMTRRWLRARQVRLNARDAQGRVDLADLYIRLLSDPASAGELLKEALEIAPDYDRAEEALRRLGFRELGGTWVRDAAGASGAGASARKEGDGENRPAGRALGDALLDLTPEEVRIRMGGDPERVARSASQGQFIEQWIYPGPRGVQYINFLQPTGNAPARVIGHFSLP